MNKTIHNLKLNLTLHGASKPSGSIADPPGFGVRQSSGAFPRHLDAHMKGGRDNGLHAFTLIEMLVVIAIIGILAALVVGGAGYATGKARRSRVEAERTALISYIQSFKNKMGSYPPDNTNTAQPSLFYELTGTTNDGKGATFVSLITQETLATADVTKVFNAGGFMNSSPDPNNVYNFDPSAAKSGGTGQFYVTGNSGSTYTLFGVPVPGPASSMTNTINNRIFNPWHYVSTNPTNNHDSFDLWMDVLWGGKTNRISNWNPDPQVVGY